MQNTLNIDTLNAYGGLGSIPGPRPSEGRRPNQSQYLLSVLALWAFATRGGPLGGPTRALTQIVVRLVPWPQVYVAPVSFPDTAAVVLSSGPFAPAGLGSRLLTSSGLLCVGICGLSDGSGRCLCVWRPISISITFFFYPTSDRTRLPAEFKHITKRRKRN